MNNVDVGLESKSITRFPTRIRFVAYKLSSGSMIIKTIKHFPFLFLFIL